jgi:hypothetical protein
MDNRRFQRTVVDREVECEIESERDFVFLYNLSVNGCMIETFNAAAQAGSLIKLNLAGLEDIKGVVIWRIGCNAGIEFDRVIPQSVVEYLGFDPSLLTFHESQPRDRYGSPLANGQQ